MAQMPEIKPVVNKEPDKKPGLLSGLFGGGGGGSGASGLAGMGTSAAGGGGILATKAGLLALVLVGTTVAGGIGVVGYKVFGPGDSDQAGQNIQLFAAKPKSAPADAGAAATGSNEGNSASLDNLAKANSGALGSRASATTDAGATKDETAATAANAATSAGAAVNTAMSAAGGNGASTSMLKNTKKLGALSTSFGGGAGSAPSAGVSNKAGDSPALLAAAKGGQMGAMKNPHSAAVAGGRAVAAKAGRRGVVGQARFARDMGRQNQYSMRGAGRGFENSTTGSGTEGIGDPNAISMGGVGDGTGAQPTSIPANPVGKPDEVKPPVPPKTYDVTPYKKEMATAQMLLMISAGLLYYVKTLAAQAKVEAASVGGLAAAAATLKLAKALSWAVIALGVVVAGIGATISGGEYAQTTQGGILLAAGIGLAAAASIALYNTNDFKAQPKTDLVAADPSSADGATSNGQGAKLGSQGMDFSTTTIMLGGGGALIGLVGNMLAPAKTCKSTAPDDASKCTSMIQKVPGSPSEKALEQYLT